MNSSQSQSYTLKRSSNEDSFSGKSTMFIPAKVAQINPKTRGIEYRQDVTDDAQYIKKIFDTNNYEHDQESLLEFYSDVCFIMDSNETFDKRNIGTVMGMASLGAIGFLMFSITLVGGLAGIIFGGTLGRVLAAKLADMRRKKEIVTQENLYLLKARCVTELGIKDKKNAKFDLNKFRLCLEKVVEEASLSLETSVFQKPKLAKDISYRLRNLLMDPQSQLAFLLSYRLFKEFLQRKDMENPTNLEKAARKIYAVYMPYIRFIELVEIPSQAKAKENASLDAYFKIKAFIARPEIVDLLAKYPEYKTTPQALESFRVFLKQEVDTTEQMKRAMSRGRQSISEQIALKTPVFLSKPNEDNPSEQVLQKANDEDSIASYPSTKNFNFDELCEGVSAYNAEVYVSGKKTRYGPIPSLSNLHSGQKDFTINMSQMPEIERTTSNILFKKSRATDQDDSIREVVSATKQKTQQGEDNKAQEYLMLGVQSPEQSRSQDRSNLMSVIQLEQVESPMSKAKKQQSAVNTPQKNGSPTNKEAFESPEENKLLQNSIGDNVQNKVIFDKVLSIGYDNASKWDRVVNSPIIRIDKIKPEGSPVVLIRAWANITGYSPQEVFQQIYDTENRAKWDTVTVNLRVIEDIDPNTAIIHFVIKAPIGISDRDFVQRRIFQKDYPEKGTITMGFQSFAHPNCPPVKGRVRGETHIAGYILKPSATDPKSTDMCILTQVDIKGSIPKIIVNMAAGKAPAEWVHKLIKACERARDGKKK